MSKQRLSFSTRRLEALTDGVFAIAMTLLVLDLAVPVAHNITTSGQLWSAMAPLLNNFISLVISFIVLAMMWGIHVRQFEQIKYTDNTMLYLNNLRLGIVVLIPFTTSLLSAHNNIPLAQFIYPLNLFVLGLVTYIQGQYMNSHPSFFENYDKKVALMGHQRSLAFVILSGCVMVASPFIGSWAYFGFFLMPFVIKLLYKRV